MNNLKPFKLLPRILFSVLFLLFTLPATFNAGELEITLTANTLSVKAEKIPLQTILLELVKEKVTIKIDPQINPPITANFKNLQVQQALNAILKNVSYSLLWENRLDSKGENVIALAEIQIFYSERKNLIRPLVPERKREIAKMGGNVFYVKDEIILFLPADTDMQALENFIKTLGGILVYSNAPPGPAKILLPPDSDVFSIAKEIQDKLYIGVSQPNYAYPLESPVNYRAGTNQAPEVGDTGAYVINDQGISIAILDSGLAQNTELDKLVKSSLDAMAPGSQISDSLGHGTQMAYIASGVIKPYGVSSNDSSYIPIIPIRAFDNNGYTTDFNIMNSIDFALDNNAKVMSLSWGSETRSDFMEKAFEYAREKNLVIVASAGNEPTGKPVYPAAYTTVIGVGALEPHGKTWENSNYGNFVSLYAPGFANLPVGYKGEPGIYAGTSIATAHVANSIAVYLSENPDATMKEIQNFLEKKY